MCLLVPWDPLDQISTSTHYPQVFSEKVKEIPADKCWKAGHIYLNNLFDVGFILRGYPPRSHDYYVTKLSQQSEIRFLSFNIESCFAIRFLPISPQRCLPSDFPLIRSPRLKCLSFAAMTQALQHPKMSPVHQCKNHIDSRRALE